MKLVLFLFASAVARWRKTLRRLVVSGELPNDLDLIAQSDLSVVLSVIEIEHTRLPGT